MNRTLATDAARPSSLPVSRAAVHEAAHELVALAYGCRDVERRVEHLLRLRAALLPSKHIYADYERTLVEQELAVPKLSER